METQIEKELTTLISYYENGMMDEDEITSLFQFLVDTGLVWSMGQDYVHVAEAYIGCDLIRR